MTEFRPHLASADSTTQIAPYKELNPKNYRIFLRYRNLEFLEGLRGAFTEAPLTDDQCLIVVGSDGKLERHKQSKTDLVLVGTEGTGTGGALRLKGWYQAARTGRVFEDDFDLPSDQLPQITVLGDAEHLASYAYPHLYQHPSRIYPDRILNAQVIAGNTETYRAARRQVLHEMTDNGKKSRKIRHEMMSQYRHYKQACETGLYRDQPIFTQEPPLQYYDEDPSNYRTGFKLAFLRSVQRYLDIMTTIAVREGRVTIDELVDELPAATCDKILYLARKGVLPADRMTLSARDAYMWFMQQYHFAQELYKRGRSPVALTFDLAKYEKYKEMLQDFTKDLHYPETR